MINMHRNFNNENYELNHSSLIKVVTAFQTFKLTFENFELYGTLQPLSDLM